MALIRTGSGSAPGPTVHPSELDGAILEAADLPPAEATRLPSRNPDTSEMVHLSGQMAPYRWAVNGAPLRQERPHRDRRG